MAEQQFEFRVGKWLDTKPHPMQKVYGIEARPKLAEGEKHQKTKLGMGWMPCMQAGMPMSFPTESEALEAKAKLEAEGPLEEVEPQTVAVQVDPAVAQADPSMVQAEYSLVYLFNREGTKVLLIHKDHPHFMANRWNGLGGKIKPEDASPICGAVREVFEECGIGDLKEPVEIMPLFNHQGNGYLLRVFCGFTDRIDEAKTMTTEEVQIFPVDELPWNVFTDVTAHILLALGKKPD